MILRTFLLLLKFIDFTDSFRVQTEDFPLLMPNSKPILPETYLCTTLRLDENNTYYIVGFEPQAEEYRAHHMLLYGCKQPGEKEPIFSCGEMGTSLDGTKRASPCRSGQKIIYAWAKNAPKLDLPKGVGFKVGGPGADVKYLVLQVHYARVDKIPTEGDTSGVVLKYTNIPQPRSAGVYFVGTGGLIPPQSTTHMEAACTLRENLEIHPFAFRTHTHSLGRVVSGWKVGKGMEWTLIGKKDPQLPQMFYPVENTLTLNKGDTVAARCTMVSYRSRITWVGATDEDEMCNFYIMYRSRITWVGATDEDEMCNFYIMYWVSGDKILNNEVCRSMGPPVYSWSGWLVGGGLSNIPQDASSLE
ncbi:peptidylglycine alpha-hydroxylating monooxygenase isoform X2 [Eurytemora carolleeae]|uniref:peptidylglycine alpha-hydroxylating monooxygenase isoform X2 n=1 Tax=Eurytemora carolleeae TaxID=1294199 RepID=UPI000C790BF5|nr:peptidylglycine alpha-hydroxylating monooxygenase isoform X2 [Eurytemora carolleeae]|eukprot:XP_023347961.1 peptidylglycine alpha-hydroxylating monooxygenase-like isoform X2 [Eurytemora affinis]